MVKNFGENVTFQPVHVYTPTSEEEVLSILDRHADRQVRVRGSLHSWSPVAATDDVLIDLQAFDRVAVETNGMGQHWADVGGGCVLERLVDELERRGLTLPTIGAVTKQTVAGAIATATHGSGASRAYRRPESEIPSLRDTLAIVASGSPRSAIASSSCSPEMTCAARAGLMAASLAISGACGRASGSAPSGPP